MMKQEIQKLLDFGPLTVLFISIIASFSAIDYTSGIVLHWRHCSAFVFLLATTVLFFIKHQLGVLCLGLTLIVGLVGMLSVDATITTTTISIGKSTESQVQVFFGQPKFLLWLAIHFILSRRYYVGILTEKYWSRLWHNTNTPINQSTN